MKIHPFKINLVLCFLSIFIGISNFFYFINFYNTHGYLPPPFIMDRYDTFMDFFNVNWWANRGDFYYTWKGFYSPLNIYLANYLNDPLCVNEITSILYRKCAPLLFKNFGIIVSFISFVLLLIYSRKNIVSILMVICFFLSMPFLFALERGNYILIPFAILSFTLFVKKEYVLIILYSLVFNFKFYLALPIFLVLRYYRNIHRILFFVLSFLLVIVFSHFIIAKEWYLIPYNILNFSSFVPSPLHVLWNATNFNQFHLLLTRLGIDIIYVSYFKILVLFINSFIIFRFVDFIKYYYSFSSDKTYLFYLSIIFLLLISSSVNYYGIILLYPFFIYLNNSKNLSTSTLVIILLLITSNTVTISEISYPFTSYEDYSNIYGWKLITYDSYLSLTSIFTPLLLSTLFIKLTMRHATNE